VGKYVITPSLSGSTLSNYSVTSNNGTLTVTAAQLTITANSASRTYGMANPAFTGTVSGALNGDSFTESYSTTASTLSTAGTYAIVPSVSGTNLSDYTQSIINGWLTVTQAGTTTTLGVSTGLMSSLGEVATLTATVTSATSGVPTSTVSFYDNGSAFCTGTLSSSGKASCSVTLKPDSSNALTATYNGDANFTGSSASTLSENTITVSALDFTMGASGSTTQTVIPGKAASYQFSVTPLYGAYASAVSFTASGLPTGATATFSPATISATGGAQTVTMTIQTAATTARNAELEGARRLAPLTLALVFLPLLGRRQRRRMGHWLCLLLLAGGLAVSTALTGCGGSYFSQAAKDYTVTVNATAGSLQHSFTVTLNVQ
jgi:hypothetical protein